LRTTRGKILRTGRRAHLVVAHEQLVGLMTAEALHSVPQQDWDVTSVQAVMLPKEKLHWAAPEEPALSLLDRMRNVGMQQMPVIAGEALSASSHVIRSFTYASPR